MTLSYKLYLCAMYVLSCTAILMLLAIIMNWMDRKRVAEKKNPRIRLLWARRWKRLDRLATLIIILSVFWPVIYGFNAIVTKMCNKVLEVIMGE